MVWKEIEGFKGYFVSNTGLIKSERKNKETILKQQNNGKGYLSICLYIGSNQHRKYVHRLVAEAFLEKQDDKNEINHKNKNKQDNNVNNIEWCTRKYNNLYSNTHLNSLKASKKIIINMEGVEFIFDSIREANRNGFFRSTIQRALKNNGITKNYTVREVV